MIEESRSQLSGDALGAFNELLGICQVANFAWWNEEHNYYIDLRAIDPDPQRGARDRTASSASTAIDEATFMFFNELHDVCDGKKQVHRPQGDGRTSGPTTTTATSRGARRCPRSSAPCPDQVDDPVLIEIFGMHHALLRRAQADAHVTELKGFPASAGVYTGRARVHASAMELFELEDGEILVTEATSPNWTPAFAIIGACVCDGGGSLTHAATVSREYGIPCVVGTSVGDPAHQDRRPDRGRRQRGHREDPGASRTSLTNTPLAFA